MKHRPARKILKKKKIINRGNRKIVYRSVIALLLFLISASFLGVIVSYRHLNKSFASALAEGEGSYSIQSEQFSSITYAVVQDIKSDPIQIVGLKFLIFDKNNNKVLVYSVPVNQKFDISGKFGEEELSKMMALGGLNSDEPIKDGITTLKYTVLKIFGFKVDRALVVDQKESDFFDELLGNGNFLDLIKLKDVINVRQYFETDLSLEEFYSAFSFIKSLPNDRIINKSLSPQDFSNPFGIDATYEDMGLDSVISKESKSISVLNGTDIPGIASLTSRVINNIGGRIVATGNSVTPYESSVIVADDPNSETCKFLSRTFGITNVLTKTEARVYENEVNRSDIVVIVGFDTSSRLY